MSADSDFFIFDNNPAFSRSGVFFAQHWHGHRDNAMGEIRLSSVAVPGNLDQVHQSFKVSDRNRNRVLCFDGTVYVYRYSPPPKNPIPRALPQWK